jgi:hypothetical protein
VDSDLATCDFYSISELADVCVGVENTGEVEEWDEHDPEPVQSFLHAKLENLCAFLPVFDSLMLPPAIIFPHLYCFLQTLQKQWIQLSLYLKMRNFGEKQCTRKIQMSPHLTAPHGMMVCKEGRYSTAFLYVYKCFNCHFMKLGDSEDIPVSKILYFVLGTGLLNEWANGLQRRSIIS